MASQKMIALFQRNISQFVGLFVEDADSLFKDDENKLIHPGEYGRYREDSCKEMLRLLLGNHSAISDGFIFTSDNITTTQCDIIVYNSIVSPIIADDIMRMFPAEEVQMFGEIKSTLSRADYIDALRKMAENKKIILDGRKGVQVEKDKRYDNEIYNSVATFLICRKLNFNIENLTYNEIYDGIDKKYWHNAVLSIEDGFFTYELDLGKASEAIQKQMVDEGLSIMKGVWSYPFYFFSDQLLYTSPNWVYSNPEDKYRHIINFFINISKCCKEVWKYEFDPVEYLGFNRSFFAEQ